MKLIHCSDLHLDSPLGKRLDPETALGRRGELLMTLQRLFDWAGRSDVSGIILSGDLFDTEHPSRQTVRSVEALIRDHAELSVFYLRGNHDEGDLLFFDRKDPPNLFRFGRDWTSYSLSLRQSKAQAPCASRPVVISGRELDGHALPGDQRPQVPAFTVPDLDPSAVNIVVLHGQAENTSLPSGPDRIPLGALRGHHIDYLALGHIHSRRLWALDERGTAAYPGCLEGRGFDECGDHGFILLDIEDDTGNIRTRFVPFASRKLWRLPCDVTGCASAVEITARIDSALRSESGESGAVRSEDLVRVEMTGRPAYDCSADLPYLEDAFSSRFYYFTVTDGTRAAFFPEDYLSDPTLKGEFVRTVLGAPDLTERDKEEILRCGLRALSGEPLL